MNYVLRGFLHYETAIKYGFNKAKHFYNLNSKFVKFISVGNVLKEKELGDRFGRQLPHLVYIQNPFTWLLIKIDFKMLRSTWDREFEEEEFKRGAKQAASVICTLISENLWGNLQGLVSRQALTRLKREVEVKWSDEVRRNINIKPEDVKLALPRKIHFIKICDQKFVDVDMTCVALKFKEKEPSLDTRVVFMEIMMRLHRNYTFGELPNWTVTLFKVNRFSIR